MATILRSSKYIRNFAELTTKLSFNHTKRDARVTILSQRYLAPCTSTKTLTTQVAAQKLDNNDSDLEIKLQTLDAHLKRSGKISKRNLERTLNAFQTAKSVTSNQALMVIRCCGSLVPDELPETRSKLVNEVWKTLENLGIQVDISHYNALLRVYIENEYAFSPAVVLAELKQKGIEPNKLTYQRLIARYCQQGDIEGASKILEFMKEKEIPVNENMFTALVRGHSEANDMVSAADILSIMRQAGIEPSADTYKELLCGYAKQGDMESITHTLSECQSRNVQLIDTDFLDVIYSLASNGHGNHVETILSIMPKAVGYTQDALSHVLKLIVAGQIDVATQILFSIPSRDHGHSGITIIKQLAKVDLPFEKFLELCKQMELKGINSRAIIIALESKLSQGNVEDSLGLLQVLRTSGVEIRQHYFWPILVTLGREKKNTAIDDLLRTIRIEFGLPISEETLREYVVPNKPGNPDEIMTELLQIGIPSRVIAPAIVYNMITRMKMKEAADFATKYEFHYKFGTFGRPLITALQETKDVKSFVTILGQIYQNRFQVKGVGNEEGVVDNRILEPYIIDAAVSIKDEKSALLTKVLKELQESGYGISGACITTLQQISHLRMTSELAWLLDRFKSKKFGSLQSSATGSSSGNSEILKLEEALSRSDSNNDSIIHAKKRLLNLYGHVKDLPKLEKLVTELKEQGVEFNDSMYRTLIRAYIDTDMLDKVEEYLTALREIKPEYTLSNTNLFKYITLLVKNNRTNDAVQVLQNKQNIQSREAGKDGRAWWKLLTALAELGVPEAVNSIFDVLLKNEYIDISGPNLGPLVKVHIVRNDLKEALNVFERICETYQYTPLKNELTKKFIQIEDATALQRLTDLSTQIHGEANSLYDLVQSFIECDCLRQAKKILEIPALHSKIHRLKYFSKRYSEQGITVYIERLVSIIKDVPHYKVIPELYNDLIYCYDKENNWEKGLKLKKQMEEEEIEPSDIFLVTLADLLKRNNRPVSFALPKSQGDVSRHAEIRKSVTHSSTRHQSYQETEDGNTNDKIKTNPKPQRVVHRNADSELIKSVIASVESNSISLSDTLLMNTNGRAPYSTLKFVVRQLGASGEIKSLEKLGELIPVTVKKLIGFESCLCEAYVMAGKTEEYLDILEKYLETATESDTNKTSTEFPIFGAVVLLQQQPDCIKKYTTLAEKYLAQGIIQPMNALWMYYFLSNDPAADNIWREHLINSPNVQFLKIVHAARVHNDPELVERLIKTVETSTVADANVKGYLYSKLIQLYYRNGNYEKSVEIFQEALKVVSMQNLIFSKVTLTRMMSHLATQGLALPAEIFSESQATEAEVKATI